MSFKKTIAFVFFFCFISNVFATRASKNSWEMTDYVWNFGIAQAATLGLYPDPFAYFKHRDVIFKKEIFSLKNEKNIIWTNPDNLKKYYPFLKRLRTPSVLIVSDGDNSFPKECGLNEKEINELLNHPNIIHIFAQNLYFTHHKVSPIPIDIDFHTLAYKDSFCGWGIKESPKKQEERLKAIINSLEPAYLRKKRIFVDFHLTDNMRYGSFKRYLEKGEERQQIFQELLKTGLIDYLDNPIPRTELWKKKGEYAFTVSPHGNGLDCHRTWEDLALGCIVIVKTSSLDSLYDGLPVVIVKDWGEVSEEALNEWVQMHHEKLNSNTDKEKLTNKFWIEKIKQSIKE
jgi:hypothetical protein